MASSTSSADIRARMEATARDFLQAYEDGETHSDASIINRSVTPDCRRYLLPASVPRAFGLAPDFFFDTTTYKEAYGNDIQKLRFRKNVMANLVIDTEARRVAFTSSAEVQVKDGGETYPAELSWYLYFNQDGSKVEKVVEFCDKDVILKMASASSPES